MGKPPGRGFRRSIVLVGAAAAVVGIALVLALHRAGEVRVSEFGRYQGYTQAVYDGNRRTSGYLTLRDGTRLAYDLIVPTRKGVPASEPLPVLFKYTPYLRSFTIFDGNGKDLIGDLFEMGWWQRARCLRSGTGPPTAGT